MKRIKKQWGCFVFAFLLILSGVLLSISPTMAYNWTFVLTPSGDLSGAPGETLTWGYMIVNESTAWLDLCSIDSDDWTLLGLPTSLFDFPTIGPGAWADGNLYSFALDSNELVGSVNSGGFTVAGNWYDADPYDPNNVEVHSLDTEFDTDDNVRTAAYSATVASPSGGVIPEPSTLLLLCSGLLGLVGAGRKSGKFLH